MDDASGKIRAILFRGCCDNWRRTRLPSISCFIYLCLLIEFFFFFLRTHWWRDWRKKKSCLRKDMKKKVIWKSLCCGVVVGLAWLGLLGGGWKQRFTGNNGFRTRNCERKKRNETTPCFIFFSDNLYSTPLLDKPQLRNKLASICPAWLPTRLSTCSLVPPPITRVAVFVCPSAWPKEAVDVAVDVYCPSTCYIIPNNSGWFIIRSTLTLPGNRDGVRIHIQEALPSSYMMVSDASCYCT